MIISQYSSGFHADGAPGPGKRWPLVGHLPAFLHNKLEFLDRCASTPEPVVELQLGEPTILLKEPADIRFVLEEHPECFEKSPKLSGAQGQALSGKGLLTSTGGRHGKLRESLHPAFTRSALRRHTNSIESATSDQIRRWRVKSTIDCRSEMEELAEGIVGRILFPGGYEGEHDRLARSFRTRKRYLQYRFEMPFLVSGLLPVPLALRYRFARRVIENELTARVALECEARREDTLIGQMLSAELSPREVFEEASTLAITGYETVSAALTWTLWLLSNDQPYQSQARVEVKRTLPIADSSTGSVPELPLLSMIVSEALRLYPPTWLFLRTVQSEASLPSGYRARAGLKIYLSPWVVHRDPRFYREPLRFEPERFLPAEIAARPKLSYFPFGAGPRLCLGNHLARMEMTLILARLLREFEFLPVHGQRVCPAPKMTLRPSKPVMLRIALAN